MGNKTPHNWAPCNFINYPPECGDPKYGITYGEFGIASDIMEKAGVQNDGYAWTAAIEAIIRTENPEHLREIIFDPESSMFCARSSCLESLIAVHSCINRFIEDQLLLAKTTKSSKSSWL